MKRNETQSGALHHGFSPKQEAPSAFTTTPQDARGFPPSHYYFYAAVASVPGKHVTSDKLEPVSKPMLGQGTCKSEILLFLSTLNIHIQYFFLCLQKSVLTFKFPRQKSSIFTFISSLLSPAYLLSSVPYSKYIKI